MIQIIRYRNTDTFENKNITLNTLAKPESFDKFKINIIDLRIEDIWRCKLESIKSINCINDFMSINTMIEKSKSSKIIIILPQNIEFKYYQDSKSQYHKDCLLKDMLIELVENILPKLISIRLKFYYEGNKTKIGDKEIASEFAFDHSEGIINILTSSEKSKKITTMIAYVLGKETIFTTLDLESADQIIDFLSEIGLLEEKEIVPEWLEKIKMFDDDKQNGIILLNNEKIEEGKREIKNAQLSLDENNKFKSILYTNGDDLVSTIFEILEKILDCDLSAFEDLRKEDFIIKVGKTTFIGEIKGVNTNVQSKYISQLDVHYQGYKDDLTENKLIEDVKAILIINYQKNKPVTERDPIHDSQISLAQRNESLIIDTYTLLRLFEKFLNNEITISKCTELFTIETGLLKI